MADVGDWGLAIIGDPASAVAGNGRGILLRGLPALAKKLLPRIPVEILVQPGKVVLNPAPNLFWAERVRFQARQHTPLRHLRPKVFHDPLGRNAFRQDRRGERPDDRADHIFNPLRQSSRSGPLHCCSEQQERADSAELSGEHWSLFSRPDDRLTRRVHRDWFTSRSAHRRANAQKISRCRA